MSAKKTHQNIFTLLSQIWQLNANVISNECFPCTLSTNRGISILVFLDVIAPPSTETNIFKFSKCRFLFLSMIVKLPPVQNNSCNACTFIWWATLFH